MIRNNKLKSPIFQNVKINQIIPYYLIAILIIFVYAFNDMKNIMYPLKIIFIFSMMMFILVYKKKLPFFILWALLFILLSGLSLLWSSSINNSTYDFIWLFQAFLIILVIVPFITSLEKIHFLLHAIIVGSTILIIRLILNSTLEMWGTNRIGSSVGYNPNIIGIEMVFSTIISIYYFLTTKRPKKVVYLLLSIFFVIITFYSGSRKSFLAILLGTSIFLILKSNNLMKVIKSTIYIIILFSITWFIIMNINSFYNVLGKRIEALIETFHGESSNVRIDMIKTGWALFSKKPLLGYGIGAYSIISGFNTYSHNNYMEILVNHGLIGFLMYYSIYFYIIMNLFKILKKNKITTSLFISLMFGILFLEVGVVSYNVICILIVIILSYSYSKNKEVKEL